MVFENRHERETWARAVAEVTAKTRALERFADDARLPSGPVLRDPRDARPVDEATCGFFEALAASSSDPAGIAQLFLRPRRAVYDENVALGPSACRFDRHCARRSAANSHQPPPAARVHREDYALVNRWGDVLRVSHWAREDDALPGPCVLFLHGSSGCRAEALQALSVALHLNCSLCAVDLSGSGLSGGKNVSLGLREQHDAKTVIDDLRASRRCDGRVALWGRSMGAVAAALAASALDPLICAVVLDSCFATLAALTKEIFARRAGLPPDSWLLDPAVDLVRSYLRNLGGFAMDDVDALKALETCAAPVLLVHGTRDALVAPSHAHVLQAACLRGAELAFHENGGHEDPRPDVVLKNVARFLHRHLTRADDDVDLANLDDLPRPLCHPPWWRPHQVEFARLLPDDPPAAPADLRAALDAQGSLF